MRIANPSNRNAQDALLDTQLSVAALMATCAFSTAGLYVWFEFALHATNNTYKWGSAVPLAFAAVAVVFVYRLNKRLYDRVNALISAGHIRCISAAVRQEVTKTISRTGMRLSETERDIEFFTLAGLEAANPFSFENAVAAYRIGFAARYTVPPIQLRDSA